MHTEKRTSPYPHAILTDVIPKDIYDRLRFPELPRRNNTRSGWDLFKGEKKYDDFFNGDSSWTAVRKQLDSEEFILSICNIFRDELKLQGVDIDKLQVIDFTETPAQMQMEHIAFGKFDHKIFSRFDLQASNGTTLRYPHLDHARRLFGGVLFFCDAQDEGMVGGDFGVWKDRAYKGDRKPHDCVMVDSYPIKHNTLYTFLNRNDSFHAPKPITSIDGMRRWAYFSISARQNVWRNDPGATSLVHQAKRLVGDGIRFAKYNISNRKAG